MTSTITPFVLASVWSLFVLVSGLGQRGASILRGFTLSIFVVVSAGMVLLSATSTLVLVLSFEFMLMAACNLLRLTSKSERAAEALLEMYV